MAEKVIFIIIVIIGLGIGLYLYSSGALVKGISGFNSLVAMHSGSGSSTAASSSAKPTSGSFWSFLGAGGGGSTRPSIPPKEQTIITAPTLVSGGGASGATSTINPADIPAGFTAAQLSPYFHKVRLGTLSVGTLSHYGTITLSDSNNATSTIDITGWP